MTKTILFEQLPPELLSMFQHLNDEIQELKRMIEEGETGVAVSEAEFNLVKGRVEKLEEDIVQVQKVLEDLSIDPEAFNALIAQMETVTEKLEVLSSFDTNISTVTNAALNRLTTIETKHVTLSLRDLVLPSTTITNLELIEVDEYLSTIIWSSSNPAIISQTGVVNRPSASTGNMNVVLTATAKYGSSEASKTFIISVPAAEMTDAERLDVVVDAFDYSIFSGSETDDGMYISTDQILPSEIDGVAITWESSNEGALTADGIITRSTDDEIVYLTATLVFGGSIKTKTFTMIVEKELVIVQPEPEIPEEPETPIEPDPVDPDPIEPETPVEPDPVEPEPELPTEPEAPEIPEEENIPEPELPEEPATEPEPEEDEPVDDTESETTTP